MVEVRKDSILECINAFETKEDFLLTRVEYDLLQRLLKHKALNWGKECKIILNQDNKFYCEKCQRVIE